MDNATVEINGEFDNESDEDICELRRTVFFIPTPEEIQEVCIQIQNSWTDDVRESRRVL